MPGHRLRPHPLLEVAPFIDIGVVGPSIGALRARTLNSSAGIALRGIWKGRVLGRVEYAVGREGHRLVFAMGQAF